MYIAENASRIRKLEAERARANRAEIVQALNQEQVSRRDLIRWGIFTAAGALALKNGLSPFATSAYAAVPTGAPRSPLFGIKKFTQPIHRTQLQKPIPLQRQRDTLQEGNEFNAVFPTQLQEPPARRLSYHTEFSKNPYADMAYVNPLTQRGPIEGRPPGEIFAHQRWEEYFPQAGYIMSIGQCAGGSWSWVGNTALNSLPS
jgi:hypothetical protein